MIRIEYDKDKHTMKLEGHADFSEKGTDIVCAGVSFGYMMCAAKGMMIEDDGDAVTITALACDDINMLDAYAYVLEQTAMRYPYHVCCRVNR